MKNPALNMNIQLSERVIVNIQLFKYTLLWDSDYYIIEALLTGSDVVTSKRFVSHKHPNCYDMFNRFISDHTLTHEIQHVVEGMIP